MSYLSTFRKGGVHPNDFKKQTNGLATEVFPMPEELVVAMSQHLGAPASLCVSAGDHVEKGDRIGWASSFISANVHSPVSGVIKEIRKITLPSGVMCDAAVIIPDEKQGKIFQYSDEWKSMDSSSLLERIKDMGVVGLGGATFPAHVKLTVPAGKKVYALIINGVECEPYLTSDHRLMLERTDEILEGVMICSKILNPEKIIIGIECNKMDAVRALTDACRKKKLPVKVMPLKMKYPQGDEKQLIKATINREIPSGMLPLDVGAVVVNVGTSYAVYKAVACNQPLFERNVTVSGACFNRPCNVIVPIGTKVCDIVKYAGGFKSEPDKLISGGPMMGFSFYDENTPVCKGTSGILAVNDTKDYKQTECIHCGKCVAACPIGLLPTKLYSLITAGMYKEAMQNSLMDCKECGCCSFSCPAHLDLVQAMKTGKKMGRKK